MDAEGLSRELGSGLLRPVALPERGAIELRAAVICGGADEIGAIERGDLVLAVAAASDAERLRIIAAAAAREAGGVVVKARGALDPGLLEEARRRGVPLLVTDDDVTWGRLYELAGSAIASDRGALGLTTDGGGVGDLFELADAIASACGAPVTIEDAASQVLAFSREGQDVDDVRVATILGRRVPGPWAQRLREQAELDGVLASDQPAVIEVPGMAPRRVIAIRGAGMLLGSIWLAGPTDASADDVLREAAALAALRLLRQRAERELEYAARSAAVTRLLQTGELSERTAAETGLRPSDGFAVLALEVAGDDPSAREAAVHDQAAELIAAHLLAFRRRATHATVDGRGYVVAVCDGDARDHDALAARLQDAVTRARRTVARPLRVGLGVPVSGRERLPDARATADRALELGGTTDRVVRYAEVHAAALVDDVEAFVAARRDGGSDALRVLAEHDRAHGTELVTTVRTVLELFGDTGAAARRLHVHANTVRYRLRQALELTGLRLTDGTARLALELELRALARGDERAP